MSVQPHLGRAGTSPPAGTARPVVGPGALQTWALRHSVGLALLATATVHLLWLSRRLGADEGGFAMVARTWDAGGRYLYGPQWVDRPPGLIAVFALADRLGPFGVRLVATVVATTLVAAVAWAAEAVGGRSAARWSAWCGFALASSALLAAQQLNGELVAAGCVAVSLGALLRSLLVSRRPLHTATLGALAGASAGLAVLAKQDFVDAVAFAVVLMAAGLATRRRRLTYRPARARLAAAGYVVGLGVTAVATLLWTRRHGGPGALLFATVGFRAQASAVIARWSWAAPLHRLRTLVLLSVLSGLLMLLVQLAWSGRHRLLRVEPLPTALAVAVLVELAGVAAGGNYWAHYLLALVPTVALAAGLGAVRRTGRAAWTRGLVVVAVVATAVASPAAAWHASHVTDRAWVTGRWLAAAAQPRDSVVVPFTHANVIGTSGLLPAYPYAWSLPLRTLDPRLRLLTRTLDSPTAPTWVVRWDAPHTWGLDPHDTVDRALERHYRPVATVCGHVVWLHDGVYRRLPAARACGNSRRGVNQSGSSARVAGGGDPSAGSLTSRDASGSIARASARNGIRSASAQRSTRSQPRRGRWLPSCCSSRLR